MPFLVLNSETLSQVFCVGLHLELLGDQRIMPMHQAMRVRMPATVTGVGRHRLQVNCEWLEVQFGAQSPCIPEAFLSHHCRHLRRLVVPGRQESDQRLLHPSQETSMLMFRCRRGKQWDDLT